MKRIILFLSVILFPYVLEAQIGMMEVYSVKRQANMQSENGQFEAAIVSINKALKLCEDITGKNDTAYIELLCTKSEIYYQSGDPSSALQVNKEARKIQSVVEGKTSQRYVMLLEDEAACHLQLGNQKLAKRAIQQALKIAPQCIDTTGYDYATVLKNVVDFYVFIGQFDMGVIYAKKAIKLFEGSHATDSIGYPYTLLLLGRSLFALEKYQEAYKNTARSVTVYEGLLPENAPELLEAQYTLAVCLFQLQKDYEALQLANRVSRTLEYNYGIYNPLFFDIQNIIADIYYVTQDYNSSLLVLNRSEKVCDSLFGYESMEKIQIIGKMCKTNISIGNNSTALQYARKCVDICIKNNATKKIEYIESLNLLALSYGKIEDYDSAYYYQSLAVKIMQNEIGVDNRYYLKLLMDNSDICSDGNKHDEALAWSDRAIEIADSVFGRVSEAGASVRLQKAYILSRVEDYWWAIMFAEEALNTFRVVYNDDNHISCHQAMSALALFYEYECRYEEAIELLDKIIDNVKKYLGESNFGYCSNLHRLSIVYGDAGFFTKAIQTAEEECRVLIKYYGQENQTFANAVGNLGNLYYLLGNYDDAIEYKEKELAILKKIYADDNDQIVSCETELVQFHIRAGREDSLFIKNIAFPLVKHSINKYNQFVMSNYMDEFVISDSLEKGIDNLDSLFNPMILFIESINIQLADYPNTLLEIQGDEGYRSLVSTYASIQSNAGHYKNALKSYKLLIKPTEDKIGEKNFKYSQLLNNVAICYASIGKYDSAMVYSKAAISINAQLVDSTSPNVTKLLGDLIQYSRSCNQNDSADIWTERLIKIIKRQVRQKFTGLSSSERSMFWQLYRETFDESLPKQLRVYQSPLLIETALNGTLFSKGLLLVTDTELKTIVQENGNEKLSALYDTLRHTRLWLDKLYSLPIEQRKVSVDSLERVATSLERRLAYQSSAFGDFTASLNVDWHDVQKKLKQGEAAVEFTCYSNKDSTYYGAFVVHKEDAIPHWVSLSPLPTSLNIRDMSYYSNGVLSRWLWGELSSNIGDVKTVFFSPAGNLHSVGIEYLPDYQDTTRRIFDRWQLYRLSSTRELALNKERIDTKGSAVYGGLKYYVDTTVLIRDKKRHPNARGFVSHYNDFDTPNRGMILSDLPGTKIEALCVNAIFEKQKIGNVLFVDTLGTEASFKTLSGQRKTALLVSTHGFYWTNVDSLTFKNIKSIGLGDEKSQMRYIEDKALSKSGLFLAGSQNAIMGGKVPNDVEDGILTAKEVAGLDLRGMDLVVLSACQTGLGDIGGDGVFGLQRGFKKAGVNSIIMSLWSVDDFATMMLMTHFYDNLVMKKMTKKKALETAQEYVRNFEIDEDDWTWDEKHNYGWPNSAEAAQGYVCNYKIDESDWKEAVGKRGGIWHPTSTGGNKKSKKENKIKSIKPYQHPKYWAGFVLLDGVN